MSVSTTARWVACIPATPNLLLFTNL